MSNKIKEITISIEELKTLHRLKSEVFILSEKVDPYDSLHWFDMVFGFLMGAGIPNRRAHQFTDLIIYDDWLEQLPPIPEG